MAKLLIWAEVEDLDKWEAGFRTHGELFKRYTTRGPILFGAGENNTVGLYWEVDDLDAYLRLIFEHPCEKRATGKGSPSTAPSAAAAEWSPNPGYS